MRLPCHLACRHPPVAGACRRTLPISIAGLGVREGVLVLLLASYGVSAPDALAYGLVAFAVSVLAPGLAGAIVEADRLLLRPAQGV